MLTGARASRPPGRTEAPSHEPQPRAPWNARGGSFSLDTPNLESWPVSDDEFSMQEVDRGRAESSDTDHSVAIFTLHVPFACSRVCIRRLADKHAGPQHMCSAECSVLTWSFAQVFQLGKSEGGLSELRSFLSQPARPTNARRRLLWSESPSSLSRPVRATKPPGWGTKPDPKVLFSSSSVFLLAKACELRSQPFLSLVKILPSCTAPIALSFQAFGLNLSLSESH
ncbi:hypothetical protein B0H67DRAFT_152922 [Lasiosphaeris hirsuta]|uniref:Uncharacterized protein n=1 Tax=Lasiosphaeris hirsuta TaxID=260670 RepID=A0AA40AP72_9PEZI|nr:hypothetical protein B0H67DRAFT_152922 [Lasiosphaeris hirsuta]